MVITDVVYPAVEIDISNINKIIVQRQNSIQNYHVWSNTNHLKFVDKLEPLKNTYVFLVRPSVTDILSMLITPVHIHDHILLFSMNMMVTLLKSEICSGDISISLYICPATNCVLLKKQKRK